MTEGTHNPELSELELIFFSPTTLHMYIIFITSSTIRFWPSIYIVSILHFATKDNWVSEIFIDQVGMMILMYASNLIRVRMNLQEGRLHHVLRYCLH